MYSALSFNRGELISHWELSTEEEAVHSCKSCGHRQQMKGREEVRGKTHDVKSNSLFGLGEEEDRKHQ